MITNSGYLDLPYLSEPYLAPFATASEGMQVNQRIFTSDDVGTQALQRIFTDKPLSVQAKMKVFTFKRQGTQVQQRIFTSDDIGVQSLQRIFTDKPLSIQARMKVFTDRKQGAQAQQRIFTDKTISMQSLQRIFTDATIGIQSKMRVFTDRKRGFQTKMLRAARQASQVTMVIYNITQLRILMNFTSRGTPALSGNNWLSTAPLKAGDFGASNLNTDLLEQRCQTQGTPAIWELRCDTGIPQGAFVDTAAIMAHNFTKSARITMQGSNDPFWSSAGFSVVLITEIDNMYYIAPTLPTDGYRYWRFLIEDSTNPSELYIGAIVFGSARIMTVRENFQNPVTYGRRHFKDTIETEGFTNVSNDRATRKNLSLNFSDLLIDASNYNMFIDYMNHVKTDLKALIIPRPTRPSAFAIFSKLTQLPEETHNAIDDDAYYISFTLSWDEGL
jgi:hypothetical protein